MAGLSIKEKNKEKEAHESFIARCIELAKRGGRHVRPNPQVGSVLVWEGNIIGEGYHRKYGHAHAEVNCLQSVSKNDAAYISSSTLYVSLEPCNIIGKTPACSDLILREKIQKVVIGALDPNPLVHGKSLRLLGSKGVSVLSGICKKEAEQLIRPFAVNLLLKRPYVILKTVKSEDHKIGRLGEKIWLSNPYSTILSHKWRSEADGILVGTNTVLNDNPALTTREYPGENPVRIVLDATGRIPADFRIFSNEAKTLIISQRSQSTHQNADGIEADFKGENFIGKLLEKLYNRGIFVLLVEGGAKTIQAFLQADLWDEARIIRCPATLKNGINAPNITGKLIHGQNLMGDKLEIIINDKKNVLV